MPKAAAAKAAPKVVPKAAPRAAPKAAAAPGLEHGVRVFHSGVGANWLDTLSRHHCSATSVCMATFCYDDPGLHSVVLRRVQEGMSLCLVVDREYFASNVAFFQRPRLKQLRDAGADILHAGGSSGNMHYKIVVLDRAITHHGGSNLTKASRSSYETMV